MTVAAGQRHREILRLAHTDGRVEVNRLAAAFQVSDETVRRDLTILELNGALRRVHGGAIPLERDGREQAVAVRDTLRTVEKDRIAKAALTEIPEFGSILLDAGTTTARLAEQLSADRELTVIVNSPVLAWTLSTRPNLIVHLLGGRVRGQTASTVDDWALRPLADMFVDVAFLGTSGLSIEHGLTTPDGSEAAVKRAMIAASRRTVVLADHTKIGVETTVRFAQLSDVDLLVTDSGLDVELGGELDSAGVRLVQA